MDESSSGAVEQLPENAAAAAAFPDEQSPFDKTLYNISGILTNKYPDIDFQTIPGFNPGSGGSTSTNFLFFMFSLIFGMVWITYITFFNSRIVGKILTRICSRFVTDGYVRVRNNAKTKTVFKF